MVNPKHEIRAKHPSRDQFETNGSSPSRGSASRRCNTVSHYAFVGDLAGRMTETPNSKILRFGNLVIWI